MTKKTTAAEPAETSESVEVAPRSPSLSQIDTLLAEMTQLRAAVAARPPEPAFTPPDPEGNVALLAKHITRLHNRIASLETNCGMNPAPHPLEEDEVFEEHAQLAPRCASFDPVKAGPPAPRRARPLVRKFEAVDA